MRLTQRGDLLDIEYKNKALCRLCTNASVAAKKYGQEMAEKIQIRIDQIRAAESIEQMLQYRVGRCHQLRHNRSGQYAVDLVHPMRLVFECNETEIQIACIIEITDYHR